MADPQRLSESAQPLNTRGGTPLTKGAQPGASRPAPREAPQTPPASNATPRR